MKKLSITLTGLLFLVNILSAQVAISEKDFIFTGNSYDNLAIKDYIQVSPSSWNALSNSPTLLNKKEMYTTAKCPNFAYGHKAIEALPKDCNKALVAHHAGFGEDNFTIQDSYDYMYAFGVRGAPNATADRTFIPENNGVAFNLGYTNVKQGAEAFMKNLAFTKNALPAFTSIRATAGYDK